MPPLQQYIPYLQRQYITTIPCLQQIYKISQNILHVRNSYVIVVSISVQLGGLSNGQCKASQ